MLTSGSFSYAHDEASRLGSGYTITLPNGNEFTRSVSRDPYSRHLLTSVSSSFNGVEASRYAYAYDALDRPVSRNGDTFTYNARGEVSAAWIQSSNAAYWYDEIGNLSLSRYAAGYVSHFANSLNQYTSWRAAGSNATVFSHDIDGNMTGDGRLAYTYDAANRLASVSGAGGLVVTNLYDSLSRRARKITPEYTATYFHDGWNLVEERVAYTNGATETIEYFWGKDLSESLQGAGGVGGLLCFTADGETYIPCYDANGNVMSVLDSSGEEVAAFVYDAFGRAISASGPALELVRFRYSTKYFDDETGLYYYGYRFYSPDLMRWLNRDTIEESGGLNLYAFCLNNALSGVDFLGNEKITLRYDMSPKFGIGDRIAKPKGTKHIPTGAGVIADIKKQVKTFDKDGKGKCKCIEKLYLGGHGHPGGVELGDIDMNQPIYDTGRGIIDNEYPGGNPEDIFGLHGVDPAVTSYAFFKIISQYLCKDAHVEFVTCASGRGTDGQRLKEILQELLGTKNIKLYETAVCYKNREVIQLPEDKPVKGAK